MRKVSDLNVASNIPLPAPALMLHEIPRSESQEEFVAQSRQDIHNIIFHDDPRLLAIVGPCSIHDVKAGLEYASRLRELNDRVGDGIYLVMRCYFEKPRTTVGWKGLIMDPYLDGSVRDHGGASDRPTFSPRRDRVGNPHGHGTARPDHAAVHCRSDLLVGRGGENDGVADPSGRWRRGCPCPWDSRMPRAGAITPAVNAIQAAGQPQTFFGISGDGVASAVSTKGNPNCHLILRGGDSGANYDAEHVAEAERQLTGAGVDTAMVIDCSHGNSGKDAARQPDVVRDVVAQRTGGTTSIVGVMLESNLLAGNQSFPQPLSQLEYGKSVTDACLGWETTEELILEIAQAMQQKNGGRQIPAGNLARHLGE